MADGDPPTPPPRFPFLDAAPKLYMSDFLNLKTYSVNGPVSQASLSDENPSPVKTSATKSIQLQTIDSISSPSISKISSHDLRFGKITFQDLVSSGFAGLVGASPPTASSIKFSAATDPSQLSPGVFSLSSKIFNFSSDQAHLSPATPPHFPAHCFEVSQSPSVSSSVNKLLATSTTKITTDPLFEVVKSPNDSKSVQRLKMPDCKQAVSLCSRKDSVTPIWIRMEGLPPYMFEEAPLLAIASTIGTPLCVDLLITKRVKLNSARVCVEVNVSGPLINSFWVAFEDDVSHKILEGFWVRVYYEVLPSFGTSCLHSGLELQCCISRSGKQGDVTKVFDKLTQSVSPTVHKVFDSMSLPAENSKVIGSLNHSCALGVGGLVELPDTQKGPEQQQVVQQRSSTGNEVRGITGNNIQSRISAGKTSATGFHPLISSIFQPGSKSVNTQGSAASATVSEGSAAISIAGPSKAGSAATIAGPSKATSASTKFDRQLPAAVVESQRKEWVFSKPRKEWICSCVGLKPAIQQVATASQRQEGILVTAGTIPAVQEIDDQPQPNCSFPQTAKPGYDQTKMEFTEGSGNVSQLQPAVYNGKKGMNHKNPEVGFQTTVASDKQKSSLDDSNPLTDQRDNVHGDQQKLYYHQISKYRSARKWFQIAPVRAVPSFFKQPISQQQNKVRHTDILKPAILQQQAKFRYTAMRSQGHPFDDKG